MEVLADGGRVGGVRFERTAPDGHGGVTGTGRYEDVPAQLVLRSVGYRGVPLEGLPFDPGNGTVPHREGRVLRELRAGGLGRRPTSLATYAAVQVWAQAVERARTLDSAALDRKSTRLNSSHKSQSRMP